MKQWNVNQKKHQQAMLMNDKVSPMPHLLVVKG